MTSPLELKFKDTFTATSYLPISPWLTIKWRVMETILFLITLLDVTLRPPQFIRCRNSICPTYYDRLSSEWLQCKGRFNTHRRVGSTSEYLWIYLIALMPTTFCQNSFSNLKEVAIIIGLNSCNTTVCPPCDLLGSILYNGGYNPLLDMNPPGRKPPYQNFSLSIAPSFKKGRAQLNIFHVALNGVSIFACVFR